MARPPQHEDEAKNLKPEDKTQRTKAGTNIGLVRRGEIFRGFRKIVRGKKH